MPESRRLSLIPITPIVILALLMFIGGCSQPSAQPTAAAPATPAASTPAAPSTPATAPATSAAAPTLPSADGDQPGLRLTITDLKRTSTTLTLRLSVFNDADKDFAISGIFTEAPYRGYRTVAGIHLIDAGSKKKYFVVADSDNKCVCSDDIPDIPKKSQVNVWAKFPAPPDDVQKMTVQVPHFVPIEDVAISK